MQADPIARFRFLRLRELKSHENPIFNLMKLKKKKQKNLPQFMYKMSGDT